MGLCPLSQVSLLLFFCVCGVFFFGTVRNRMQLRKNGLARALFFDGFIFIFFLKIIVIKATQQSSL